MRASTLALGLILLSLPALAVVPTAAATCDVTDLGPPTCAVEFLLGRECIENPLAAVDPRLDEEIC